MYGNGIMLVAGQNKGAMLQLLLASTDYRRIASIVFVDDTVHNVENVDKAFDQTVREIEVFRYAFMDADIDDFLVNEDRKRISSDSWSSLRSEVCLIFGRFCFQ